MLAWTLEALEKTEPIGEIVLVVHPSDLTTAKRLVRRHRFRKVTKVVAGGKTRSASVFHGLQAVSPDSQWVMVHDGARPLVTPDLFRATIQGARRFNAAIAAVPVVPTVKQAIRGWVQGTLDRGHLWAVQTPQVFRRDVLKRAYAKARANGVTATDDAALVEALGQRVRIVMGSERNIKVTTPEDLLIAETLLNRKILKGSDPFRAKRV